MLTDMIVEEEFEVKEAELVPWYAKQDLEHDLHLAAELGKSLLERNKELEQGLQQMYSTNQEQLQEIEYLTKQVELLRQVNEQHTKVYEQLDLSARELEQNNQRLGLDNRAAQQKIQGLLETAETLQSQVEELQREVEELKTSRPQPRGTRSVSCLSELRNTRRPGDHAPAGAPEDPAEPAWREEERASLQRSLRSLQTKLAAERARREEAERDADLLAGENAALERQLGATEGCRARLDELECEAEELRQLWRVVSSAKPAAQRTGRDPPPVEEEEDEEEEEEESAGEGMGDETRCQRRPGHAAPDAHERSCLRRSDAVKYRGISLLNEVDAQYSALQDKYDALLRRCSLAEPGGEQESQSHKAVQTAPAPTGSAAAARTELAGDFHQPEYKALFKEIFSCIQRTREDLRGNSGGVPHGSNGAAPIPAGTHGELVGTRNDRALSI